jgi:hypothetical protein
MEKTTNLVRMIIANYISIMISKGVRNQLPVELLEFYDVEEGVQVSYKTISLFDSKKQIVKKGLFFLKDDQWHFGELDYRATVEEYNKEKEGEKVVSE